LIKFLTEFVSLRINVLVSKDSLSSILSVVVLDLDSLRS